MQTKRTPVYKTAFVDLQRVECQNNSGEVKVFYEFVDGHVMQQSLSLEHKVQLLTQIVGEMLHKQSFPKS
jgi:hypothetical protein